MASASLDDDLFDSVAADFLARYRAGEQPTVEEYSQRYPDIAAEIHDLFPTMLAIERMKLQKEHSSDGRASLGARKIERLGDFRIVREIGRGGMGIVYEAEQESLQRHVALKVLPPNALQDDSHVRRFHREAQTAAALHHTNIVPVFGVGEEDGLHYYVMQLIDGDPLDRRLQATPRQPLEPSRAADMVRQIAEAVQYAHDHGTLHRDIKPANLLLDRTGNVWITDFGLAHMLERDETVTDHVAGTLRYMAPERFRGVTDERSDQYSLGITLYELVTGTRAFEGTSSGELLHRISHSDPIPVKALAPEVPRDLQTIIEKTISKDPAHRYARVGDLAHDLERFLEGRPILARRVSTPERLWRWCRRNRALAASLLTVAALLLVVAGMLVIGYVRTRQLNLELTKSLNKEQVALRSEQIALANERRATDKEREARKAAEALTSLALEGLDRVFDEFAPAEPYTVAIPVSRTSTEEDEPLLLPAQATVSPKVAAALERLLPLYQRLADETAQDPQVRLRAASAQYRLGLIYRQLGRQDAARTAFWAARSLLEALEQEHSVSAGELRLPLVQVLNDLGDLDRQQPQRYRERQSAFQQALTLLSIVPESDLTREERIELARTHFYLGRRDGFFMGPSFGGGSGRSDRGDRPRGSDRPGDPSPGSAPPRPGPPPPGFDGPRPPPPPPDGERNEPTRVRNTFVGPGPRSRDANRKHLTTAIGLLEQFPHAERDAPARLLLARAYREQSTQRSREDRAAAHMDWTRAVEILKELVADSPDTPDFRFELSEAYADIEPRWLPDEQLTEIEPRLREAHALSSVLVSEAPDVPAYAAGHTQILVKIANILRRTGRTMEAEQRLREALDLQTALARKFPETPTYAIWSARIRRSLADLMLTEEQFEPALALLQSAASEIEPLLNSQDRREDPSAFFASFTLFEIYGTIADILQDQEQAEESARYREMANRYGPGGFFRRRPPDDEPRPNTF